MCFLNSCTFFFLTTDSVMNTLSVPKKNDLNGTVKFEDATSQ